MPDEYKRHPWERQEDEPEDYFREFAIYRDLGPNRTIAEAWRIHADSNDQQAPRSWRKRAKRYDWQNRAEKWDERQDRLARQSSSDKIQKAKRRHANLAEMFQEEFVNYIEDFQTRPKEERRRQLERMNMKEMLQAISIAVDIEKDALGDDEESGNPLMEAMLQVFDGESSEEPLENDNGREIKDADYEVVDQEEEMSEAENSDST